MAPLQARVLVVGPKLFGCSRRQRIELPVIASRLVSLPPAISTVDACDPGPQHSGARGEMFRIAGDMRQHLVMAFHCARWGRALLARMWSSMAGQRMAKLTYSTAMSAHPRLLRSTQRQASVRRYHGDYEAHTHGHAQILVGLLQAACATMGK